jgi:hypothetical protein
MLINTPEGQLNLRWEPAKYKTQAAAAKALYKELQRQCKLTFGSSDGEVWIKSPEESEQHGYVGRAWHVCWESGPYDWGVCTFASGDWGHCETYWGFDLAFYE